MGDKQAWSFHVGAWLAWLMAALMAALLTRNPLYLLLVMLAALAVNARLGHSRAGGEQPSIEITPGRMTSSSPGFGVYLRAVVGVFVLITLLKGFSIHIGATILFTLPESWPVIGGPVTLEGLAFSALDALSLLAVLAVVATFSTGADYYSLLRSVPAFMHQVGLVTSIAITFVPQTITRFTEIREAQALRGHRLRRASDLVPLVIPLLAGGMERSVNLAEAMEARGFTRINSNARAIPPFAVQVGLAAALGLVLTGGVLLAYLPGSSWVGQLCIAAGACLVALTLWAVGRGMRRTRYRIGLWRENDTMLLVASSAVVLILLTYKLLAPSALAYDPLARLRIYAPPFDVVMAVALGSLAFPVLFPRQGKTGAIAARSTGSV